MAKKKIIRKSNRTLNLFVDGGDTKQTWDQQAKSSFQNSFSSENLGNTIGGINSTMGTIINAGINNAQMTNTSNLEGRIKQSQTYKVQANNNDDLISEWSVYSPIENISWRDIKGGSTGQRVGNTINAVGSGVATGASIGGPIGAIAGGVIGLGSAIGGWISGNRKAKKKAKKFNEQINTANEKNLVALEDKAKNIDTQNDLSMLANFSAYGGPINIFNSGAIDYELAKEDLYNKQLNAMSKYKIPSLSNSSKILDPTMFAKGGKIYINKGNKGKFTDYCGGKVTSECIARGKRSKNATIRKRATFADNARKWSHALGGYLYNEGGNLYTAVPNTGQHGGNFSNGVTIIGNGGTHEENPMEGVPMGVAPDGTPNLVEQGEVKFNDYIFSNRLFATDGLLAENNLPITYAGHSFANIAEILSKESSERPNDPISKRGLMSTMARLRQAQEQLRMKENEGSKYAEGGDISWLRYTPAMGAGLGVLTDTLGLTNKPDYSNADLLGSTVDNLSNIEFTPIGNYLTYRPLDINYHTNKLNAQAGATRRAIINQSGGNRATALAGLLAADYNAQNALGNLARQAEEYNFNQRKEVEAFNRGTNQFNSEMGLRASIANQANDKLRLQARTAQAQLRDQADMRSSAGRAANLTNLFDSLGEIGREEFSRNMIQTNPALYYSISREGKITYKNGFESLSEAEKRIIRDAANRDKKNSKAKGGYLTIRKSK